MFSNETMERVNTISSVPFIELGNPARMANGIFRRVINMEAVEAYMKHFNYLDIFETVYRFTRWDVENKRPVYESFIFDKLFNEMECHECNRLCMHTVSDVVKLIKVIKLEFTGITKILLQYSGNKSIYVTLLFDEIKIRNKSTPKVIIEFLERKYGIGHLCKGARAGPAQMKRISGSRHSKTGLYSCIFPSEFLSKSDPIVQIVEYSKSPKPITTSLAVSL